MRGQFSKHVRVGASALFAAALVAGAPGQVVAQNDAAPVVDAGPHGQATTGPLRVWQLDANSPKIFLDRNNQPVWLTGEVTCCRTGDRANWPLSTLQEIDNLAAHNGNFLHIRLGPFTRAVHPDDPNNAAFDAYRREADGRYNLDVWNEAFWQRVRDIVHYARDRGVYVEVDLIDGFILRHSNVDHPEWSPWRAENNINGINAGTCTVQSGSPSAVHDRWLRKVVHTVGAYDNVVYQVGNENFTMPDWGCAPSRAWEEGVVAIVQDEMTKLGYGKRLFGTNSHNPEIEASPLIDYVNVHTQTEARPAPDYFDPRAGKPTLNNEGNRSLTLDDFTRALWGNFIRGTAVHYWWQADTPQVRADKLWRLQVFRGVAQASTFWAHSWVSGSKNVAGEIGRHYIGFTENGAGLTLELGSTPAGFRGAWIDPGNPANSVPLPPFTGSGPKTFTPPSAGMWVLGVDINE